MSSTISETTHFSVPFLWAAGSFFSCLCTVGAGAWFVRGAIGRFQRSIEDKISKVSTNVSRGQDDVNQQLKDIDRRLRESETKTQLFVTLDAAAEVAARMAIANPGLRVPDPKNAGQVICVEIDHDKR